MAQYTSWDIQELPLGTPIFRRKVERFLAGNSLRPDAMDAYYAIEDASGEIIAGGGLQGDIIKCVAVSEKARSEGLAAPLVSRLIAEGSARGHDSLKVFTKPENRAIFASMGFHLLASAPQAILLENGRGLEDYCDYLRSLRTACAGIIIMNANPFTLGHRYLVEKALEQVETLYIIPVREDVSAFPYQERLAMIRAGVAAFGDRVVVAEGSGYQISAATFPTYFLKDLSDAAETQMRLDLDLFARHIAPALGATIRFVGSEPHDPLTARYNALMQSILPGHGIALVEIPRASVRDFTATGGTEKGAISASKVREALIDGSFRQAAALCPSTTHPYLLAALAERALRTELDLPLKPGLVCPDSPGAHSDMDYALMGKGISAIRPFFARMAMTSDADALIRLGIDAEAAMLAATGGVNTHRGAIFSLGLALSAAGDLFSRGSESLDTLHFMQNDIRRIAGDILAKSHQADGLCATAGKDALSMARMDARGMALDGYALLFTDWLPFYRQEQSMETAEIMDGSAVGLRTLLRIMSTLDDTCVIRRAGAERAQQVKREAAAMAGWSADTDCGTPDRRPGSHLEEQPGSIPGRTGHLKDMCDRYAAEGISPGGAADMLALTIFIHSITS